MGAKQSSRPFYLINRAAAGSPSKDVCQFVIGRFKLDDHPRFSNIGQLASPGHSSCCNIQLS
jgi:hypothetical protein